MKNTINKKILFGLFMGAVAFTDVTAESHPILENVYDRKTTTLNGYWNRLVDPLESGYWDYRKKPNPEGFFKDVKVDNWKSFKEYSFDDAPTLNVPGDWNTQEEKLYYYESTVWYKKTFNYTPTDEKLFLYFGAVNYDAKVYVNGTFVGEHEGGYTPFNFDITSVAKPGENFVIVKADNHRRPDAVPTDNFDWWNYGGITRDVMLVHLPQSYIEDYKVQLKKGQADRLEVSIKLNGKKLSQKVRLEIPELKFAKEFQTDNNGTVNAEIKLKPELWSTENPKLYDVRLIAQTDRVDDKIGFRTIETRGREILLNGKPIFLKGISIHEEAPLRSSRAHSLEDARTLLGMAQDLGCNFVRLAHYPHNENMVREAERRGLLVWSEIPVYWTIAWENPATYQNAENQLTEMIRRDKNRASVIIWSISNETPHGEARNLFLSNLSKKARSLDDTRLISMAMERSQKDERTQIIEDPMNEFVDVISFNQYLGWYDGNWEKVDKAQWEYAYDKPLIISENGGGALFGKHGPDTERWTEEYQETLYRKTFEMYDRMPSLSGTSPWILMDFRSSKRLLPTIQKDFNRKGLYNEQMQKKKAFYVVKEWYEKK